MRNFLFKHEISNFIKSIFFNEALRQGATKESIQKHGMKRSESFVECCSVDGKTTICVHIIVNKGEFYKCIFIDIEDAHKYAWRGIMLYSTSMIPSFAIKVLSVGLPPRVQGQLIIQNLITHRRIAMASIAYTVFFYHWKQ